MLDQPRPRQMLTIVESTIIEDTAVPPHFPIYGRWWGDGFCGMISGNRIQREPPWLPRAYCPRGLSQLHVFKAVIIVYDAELARGLKRSSALDQSGAILR